MPVQLDLMVFGEIS